MSAQGEHNIFELWPLLTTVPGVRNADVTEQKPSGSAPALRSPSPPSGSAPRTTTLPAVFQIIPTAAERAHGRHSRARTTPSRSPSGSTPALRSPSPPSGSAPRAPTLPSSLRASAAEVRPDPRRRAGSRLGGQDPAQDVTEQKPVRIHAGAQISVTVARIPPRTMTLPSVFQIIPTAAERTHGRHSRARMTPSRSPSGSASALRSPSQPSGSRPGRRRCRPSLRASAAEGGPDSRRRSDLRHSRPDPRPGR